MKSSLGEFTKAQKNEIKKGMRSGIDVSIYAKPNILPDAMRGIREFLVQKKNPNAVWYERLLIISKERKKYIRVLIFSIKHQVN